MKSLDNQIAMQLEANMAWQKEKNGILQIITGGGKTKIVIDIINQERLIKPSLTVLLLVPTNTLIFNFEKEFEKWSCSLENVKIICNASLKHEQGNYYDLIVADEVDTISANQAKYIKYITRNYFLGITALISNEKCFALDTKVVFSYGAEQAISDKVIAPVEVIVVEIPNSTSTKVVIKKTKNKVATEKEYTELEYSKYLTTVIAHARKAVFANQHKLDKLNEKLQTTDSLVEQFTLDTAKKVIQKDLTKYQRIKQIFESKRKEQIYNSELKKKVAKNFIKKHLDQRVLILCGSISQAEELCPNTYHSKTDRTALNKFKKQETNHLAAVKALNRGEDIANLNIALAVQVTSVHIDLLQRLGRIARFDKDHKTATLYVLCLKGTQDEVWVNNALDGLAIPVKRVLLKNI